MKIQSLTEYIEAIKILKTKYTVELDYAMEAKNTFLTQYVPEFIFRGHSNEKYKLHPGVLRWKEISPNVFMGEYSNMECNILNDFVSDACRYIKDSLNNDYVAWLEIAQHFGVPTRLLDFTSNPLVALYFACVENKDKDASVWIVNENAYRRLFYDIHGSVDSVTSNWYVNQIVNKEIIMQDYADHSSEEYIQYPWIYKPFGREERMSSQGSVFMLWGANRGEFLEFVKQKNIMTWDEEIKNALDGFICKIDIEAVCKDKIIEELDLCGINEKFIYPGLDGIGKYIRYKYSR